MGSRREEIRELATELFARNGIQATSMRDLANAAGILPSSLYSHFESKDALAAEILHDYLEHISDACARAEAEVAVPIERLRQLIWVTLDATKRYAAALAIYHRDFEYLASLPRFEQMFQRYLEIRTIWISTIEDAVAARQLRDDVDPVVYYRWIRDALSLMTRWTNRGDDYAVEQLQQFAERVFLRGMQLTPESEAEISSTETR